MTEQKEQKHEARRRKRHGFWAGLLFGVLAASILAGVMVSTSSQVSAAGRWWSAAGHGHQRVDFLDAGIARERADLAIELILGRVEATPEQSDAVKAIVGESISALLPLAEEHRANRGSFRTELARPTLDRVAIEELREAELQLADQASRQMVKALVDAAEVLTAEQRNELIELASLLHR